MITILFFIFNKLLSIIFSLFFDTRISKTIFLEQQDSILKILKSDKSLIRWGDGESSILTGGNLYFQKNSLNLLFDFWMIIKKYDKNSKYLIATPNYFIQTTKQELKKEKKYKMWNYTRFVFALYFKKKEIQYLDSFIFREDTFISNTEIEKIWENYFNIFFIHSNFKYFKDFEDKNPNKNIIFIKINGANAYPMKREVIDKVEKKIKDMFFK